MYGEDVRSLLFAGCQQVPVGLERPHELQVVGNDGADEVPMPLVGAFVIEKSISWSVKFEDRSVRAKQLCDMLTRLWSSGENGRTESLRACSFALLLPVA